MTKLFRALRACGAPLFLLCLSSSVHAQGRPPATAAGEAPPPVAPAVESRDSAGHVTVRAVRVTSPIRIDGKLDETMYESTEAIGGFLQQEPNEGQPATERTQAWVFFDDANIYVSARNWDTHPDRMVANEMRRALRETTR